MSERIWWGWKYAIVALAVLAFLMLVALPLATTVLLKNSDSPSRNLEVLQRIEDFYAVGMLLFMAAWTFFLGGTLASFLNVVAWRVPRGKSILGSSHCPSCNTQLTFRDNVPFLGWLKNWGHCSTCDAPFSSRYFFAELILGSIFLSVAGIYLISGGYLLPFREPDRWKMLNRMLLNPSSDLIAITLLHLVTLLALFTFSLVEAGKFRVPVSVFAYCLLFVVLFALIPHAVLVPWYFPFGTEFESLAWTHQLLSLVAGLAIGFGVGCVLNRITAAKQPTDLETGDVGELKIANFHFNDENLQPYMQYGFSIIGVCCGWQSTLVVALVWLLLRTPFRLLFGTSQYYSFLATNHSCALVACLIHLSTWKYFNQLS